MDIVSIFQMHSDPMEHLGICNNCKTPFFKLQQRLGCYKNIPLVIGYR